VVICLSIKSSIVRLLVGVVFVLLMIFNFKFEGIEPTIDGKHVVGENVKPIIVVGDDIAYPPYSFLDENGDPSGFSIELVGAALEAMGYQAEIRLAEWSETVDALDSGEIDLIAGMFQSEERREKYYFSVQHSLSKGDVFALKGETIKDLESLRGQVVAVQKDDIVHEFLLKQDLDISFLEASNPEEALEYLQSGNAKYAAISKSPGHYYIDKNSYRDIRASDLKLAPNEFSVAVKKENENIMHIVNAGLRVLKENGKYQEIYDKWLGIYEPIDYKDLILKYGWGLVLIGVVIFVLMFWSATLNHRVRERTRELEKSKNELWETNQELEAAMGQLSATEGELRYQYDLLIEKQKELKQSEARNQALFRIMPDMIFIFNEYGNFIEYKGEEAQTLLKKEQFIGKNIEDIMEKDIAIKAIDKINETIKSKELQKYYYSMEYEGQTLHFESRMVPYQDNLVMAVVRNVTLETENKEYIEYLSYHDQLTGLYNRRFFEEELERLDRRENYPLCLIMADANGLKLVNDSFGHKVGDQLLIKVSEVLKELLPEERIARIGGDEFLIMIPNLDEIQAEKLIDEIRKRCQSEKIGAVDISISFGWAAKVDEEEDIHEVFNKAENYMYKKKLYEGPSMRGRTISAIVNTLHEKNLREAMHSKRVSKYCVEFAKILKLSHREIKEMETAGLMHDIGKIAVDEAVLNKPGKLDEEEYEEIKKHPEIGYRILSTVNDMADMAEIAFSHHEKWDGTGYPRGLKGKEIPYNARMVAIVDAFDAMTSERTYKKAMTEEEAGAEILRCAGTQFDPILAQIFVEKVLKQRVDEE
jgi:diguanylate cyclase (GGDEF)-like protein